MSMELVDQNGKSLGQFASNKGYSDLIKSVGPRLGATTAFFNSGITKAPDKVATELLGQILLGDVGRTARGLVRLLKTPGLTSATISNGVS